MHLAVELFDLEVQMTPKGFAVFEPPGDSAVAPYSVEPTDRGPDSLRWLGDDTPAVLQPVAPRRGPGEDDRRGARLSRSRDARWTLDPATAGR